MKNFDPYYIKDPTKPHAPVAQTGRASDGRFTAKLETNTMTDENFPIDSRWWSRYALGTRQRVHSMRPHLPGLIFPDPEGETIFSWRMICEMYEAARDALLAGSSDEEAIAAAHAHLAAKQAELPQDLPPVVRISGGEVMEEEPYFPAMPANADDEFPF